MQQNNVCVNGEHIKLVRAEALNWDKSKQRMQFAEASFKTLEFNSNELLHLNFHTETKVVPN